VKPPHPLSSISTRADSDQDDATRPKLTRRTTETREELERVGRSSESSDGGLRQSLELLRKGKANIEGGIDVLVHEVSSDLIFASAREARKENEAELFIDARPTSSSLLPPPCRSNPPTRSQRLLSSTA